MAPFMHFVQLVPHLAMTREIVANDNPNVVRFFVVRHGKTDGNVKKNHPGPFGLGLER